MGMADPVDRMRALIQGLNEHYDRKFPQMDHVLGDIEAAHPGGEVDDPRAYQPYVEAVNYGIAELAKAHGVKLDPIPPEGIAQAKQEVLLAGARLMKWTVTVRDVQTGSYVGKLMWGLPHRVDRIAVPGPVQVTFYKAAQGRTLMVG